MACRVEKGEKGKKKRKRRKNAVDERPKQK